MMKSRKEETGSPENSGMSGVYEGRYTDVCGSVQNLSLSLTFDASGAIGGNYLTRAGKGLPYVVAGQVAGNYEGRRIQLTVQIPDQPTMQIEANMAQAGLYAEASMYGLVLSAPGEYGGGTWMAWKGIAK